MTLNRRPTEPPPDPDDVLTGRCQTCGYNLAMPRRQARPPSGAPGGSDPRGWAGEFYTAECPGFQGKWADGVPVTCKTQVILVRREF